MKVVSRNGSYMFERKAQEQQLHSRQGIALNRLLQALDRLRELFCGGCDEVEMDPETPKYVILACTQVVL